MKPEWESELRLFTRNINGLNAPERRDALAQFLIEFHVKIGEIAETLE